MIYHVKLPKIISDHDLAELLKMFSSLKKIKAENNMS